jgi:hypothetical protein
MMSFLVIFYHAFFFNICVYILFFLSMEFGSIFSTSSFVSGTAQLSRII